MNRLTGVRARVAVTALVVVGAALGAGVAGLVAQAGMRATTITVTEREYKITLSKQTWSPGTVTLVVKNRGKLAHSLAIRGPGLSRRTSGTIRPGSKRTLTVHLVAGTYTLWCPVPGHAALGMKTTLKVKAAGSSGTTTGKSGGAWG